MNALSTIVVCLALIQLSSPAAACAGAPAEPDTQTVHIYMELWSGNVLDTFDGTLTKDLAADEHVTAPFSLTSADVDTILKRALKCDFFALPDTMSREWPETVPIILRIPEHSHSTPDLLRIKWGERDHTVVWYYPISMVTQRGKELFELALFIWDLVGSKEEYERLPPKNVVTDPEILYSGEDKRIGYLAKPEDTMSHALPVPVYPWELWPKYQCFDVYKEGEWLTHILVMFDPKLDRPKDTERLIMLIGEVTGGWMWVNEWHYIEGEPRETAGHRH